tara:strand:- start:109 stop:876 length:768 start_codon:yes stop_codon:yes gene_type:complete
MSSKIKISASIVLYKEDLKELNKTIACFLKTKLSKKLYLIDNTPSKQFKNIFEQQEIEYIGIGRNIGFGAAHNIVLDKIKNLSDFHLILNPDVTFLDETIPNLILQLEENEKISMIAPRVLFPNGNHQFSCRRYPTILELLARRIPFSKSIFTKIVDNGIYKDKNLEKPFFAEYLTGCFQLYKTVDFVTLKGFDERYFLYMEDVDICKKIDTKGKLKLYYPKEEIKHVLKKGSEKSIKLFFRHAFSVIKYFRKWK